MSIDFDKFARMYTELGFKHGSQIAHKLRMCGKLGYYKKLYKLTDKSDKLTGGGKTKHKTISYGGNNYIFYQRSDDYSISYRLHQESNDDRPDCIVIEVDKEERYAGITGISYDKKCFSKVYIDTYTGSTLLKLALKLLDKIKHKYNLKYVQLTDNSRKYCANVQEFINLDALCMFTCGETWYGKNGFIPFDPNKKKTSKINLKLYKNHQYIVHNTLVEETKLHKYINRAIEKYKLDIDQNKINKLIKKCINKPLIYFINRLLKDYNKACTIFYYFYEKLMDDLNMYSLHGIVYWRQL